MGSLLQCDTTRMPLPDISTHLRQGYERERFARDAAGRAWRAHGPRAPVRPLAHTRTRRPALSWNARHRGAHRCSALSAASFIQTCSAAPSGAGSAAWRSSPPCSLGTLGCFRSGTVGEMCGMLFGTDSLVIWVIVTK
jgi:hypothetical protein